MKVDINIHATATTKGEIAKTDLVFPGVAIHELDLQLTNLLNRRLEVPVAGMDFLTIASTVYAIDKGVPRASSPDRWTRDLAVAIPVAEPQRWRPAGDLLNECLSFLTGDLWRIEFVAAPRPIAQPDPQRSADDDAGLQGAAVSLFSGGLDSYIGALDWLQKHPGENLVLVGHSDRAVKGPKKDQRELLTSLTQAFPGRVDLVQVRVGLTDRGRETSFRSRSLVFLALGVYLAELLGPNIPVLIPENGGIALNPPLTPTRRGSCSTRTAHPRFLRLLEEVLTVVRCPHPLENPYQFLTKGEMVRACKMPRILQANYPLSLSCAKAGHRRTWDNRYARGCGRCVPCLFRRASLHARGWDDENYGFDVLHQNIPNLREDFHALLSFLHRNPNDAQIATMLIVNGPVPTANLNAYVKVVKNLRKEVATWLKAKAPQPILDLAGL